eukprot:1501139-Pyramimonas_sp.AAC.1
MQSSAKQISRASYSALPPGCLAPSACPGTSPSCPAPLQLPSATCVSQFRAAGGTLQNVRS